MIRRSALTPFLLALASVLSPAASRAQVFTPSMLAPVQSSDFGVYLVDGFGPVGDLAIEGIWRRGFGGYDVGLRGGVGDAGDEALVFFGVDYRNPLAVDAAPLRLAGTGAAQVAVGDGSGLGIDVGLSVGAAFTPEGLTIVPYVHPRIALVERIRPEGDLDLEILADVGVDLRFAPNLTARLGLGFGGPTADFSIGLAWR